MKNIVISLLLIIIASSNSLFSQLTPKGQLKAPISWPKKFKPEEVYKILAVYNIQDTFFINPQTFKKNHTVLAYMDKEQILAYGKNNKEFGLLRFQWNQYIIGLKKVNNPDEWLNLVEKYSIVRENYRSKVNEVKEGKVFMYLEGKTPVFVPNTKEERELAKGKKILAFTSKY
jgi:hypothetical protein